MHAKVLTRWPVEVLVEVLRTSARKGAYTMARRGSGTMVRRGAETMVRRGSGRGSTYEY